MTSGFYFDLLGLEIQEGVYSDIRVIMWQDSECEDTQPQAIILRRCLCDNCEKHCTSRFETMDHCEKRALESLALGLVAFQIGALGFEPLSITAEIVKELDEVSDNLDVGQHRKIMACLNRLVEEQRLDNLFKGKL